MSTLTTTQEMDSARALYRGLKIPKAALKVMDAATAQLERSGAAAHALAPGDTAPDFILPDVDGRCVRLYSELKKGPVALVFYRGKWCPYCQIHLRGFQKSLARFKARGTRLLAISPQLPDQSLITQGRDRLAFPVLSDVGLNTARAYGVAYQLPEALLALYRDLDIRLEDANGPGGSNALPLPATFVIRSSRTIAYAQVAADYTRRSEPLEVLNWLRELEVGAKSASVSARS